MTATFVLGLVPARGGSKGVPGKNLRPVMGKPLVAYAIQCGLDTHSIDHLVVSTDSDEISRVAREYGASVPFKRPANLALDATPMFPVIEHALHACEAHYRATAEAIVLLHPTSPLRSVEDVEACITIMSDSGCDAVISATPAKRSPHFNMMVRAGEYYRLAIPDADVARRQDAPPVFDLDTSVWVYSRRAIVEAMGRIPERTKLYLIPEERSIDLDTDLDFRMLASRLGLGETP